MHYHVLRIHQADTSHFQSSSGLPVTAALLWGEPSACARGPGYLTPHRGNPHSSQSSQDLGAKKEPGADREREKG